MGISIGGIDIANTLLNIEYQLLRTQAILEWVVNNNPSLRKPTASDMSTIDKVAIEEIKRRHPEAGVQPSK